MKTDDCADVVVVGAGAAGLATAVFTARLNPALRVRCVDGASRIGAKILVSGGSRCNVTNRDVHERDYWGGSPQRIRRVLRAYPSARAVEFFTGLGVPLHEEEDGKLFPDSNRSRTVLDALLQETVRREVTLTTSYRVTTVERSGDSFRVTSNDGRTTDAGTVVLATGGRSLPKTGSDGFGYELARRVGHSIVATTPALAPLLLGTNGHASLSGVSHPASLFVTGGGTGVRLTGSVLWTHFGISGPLALNASRHWHRAELDGAPVNVGMNVVPGATFETCEDWLRQQAVDRPRTLIATVLAAWLPAAVAAAWLTRTAIAHDTTMAHLTREERRRLAHALIDTPLDVRGSRGYNFAEATAGGVSLAEVETATMESRVCRGLYLVGEMLDVDGRLGGFNFQWAWSTAWVAASAIARPVPERSPSR